MIRVASRGSAMVLAALVSSSAGAADKQLQLGLGIEAEQASSVAGNGIALRVTFMNVGDQPFYLWRNPQFGIVAGSFGLDIVARRGDCTAKLRVLQLELADWTERFFYVPLWPNRGLIERLSVNDPQATFYTEIPLVQPGLYHLSARFVSDGPRVAGPLWPIWHGEVRSPETSIQVEAPRAEVVAMWRERLAHCLRQRCEPRFAAAKYFRLVRDAEAAELLAKALLLYPAEEDIVEAVTRQGRRQDAALLKQLREKPDCPWRPGFLEDRIRALETPDACW